MMSSVIPISESQRERPNSVRRHARVCSGEVRFPKREEERKRASPRLREARHLFEVRCLKIMHNMRKT